jgi:hypothetical protein
MRKNANNAKWFQERGPNRNGSRKSLMATYIRGPLNHARLESDCS